MKQAIPNMREIVAEIRASLPGFPANKQTELDAFALRIAGELDILEGAERSAPTDGSIGSSDATGEVDTPLPANPVDSEPEGKPAKPAKNKATAAA